ncbi:unnamed protein product [Moneuplotes crassus]|uniref:Uncharacterized protein n=1 Tax=Euplotes crassus TaxID=5936 RepID=A0AAD1U4H1_EUPCR|nr:unnamed protein product [Moneuplotes crassus]
MPAGSLVSDSALRLAVLWLFRKRLDCVGFATNFGLKVHLEISSSFLCSEAILFLACIFSISLCIRVTICLWSCWSSYLGFQTLS